MYDVIYANSFKFKCTYNACCHIWKKFKIKMYLQCTTHRRQSPALELKVTLTGTLIVIVEFSSLNSQQRMACSTMISHLSVATANANVTRAVAPNTSDVHVSIHTVQCMVRNINLGVLILSRHRLLLIQESIYLTVAQRYLGDCLSHAMNLQTSGFQYHYSSVDHSC